MVAMRTRFTSPQVLLLLVVAFIAGNVTRGLFQRDHHALQRCTAIEISESEASGAAADEPGSPQGGAELAQLLAAVAVNNTVVTTLASNSSVFADVRTTTGLFPLWWKSMRKAGVDNVLVAAADLQSLDWLRAAGVPAVLRSVERCNASWVACAKFDLLRDVTRLGYNVLFLDTDLLVFKNPLHHLVGDSDFEATTEGFGASDASDPAPGPYGDYKLLHFRGWPPLHFYRLPQVRGRVPGLQLASLRRQRKLSQHEGAARHAAETILGSPPCCRSTLVSSGLGAHPVWLRRSPTWRLCSAKRTFGTSICSASCCCFHAAAAASGMAAIPCGSWTPGGSPRPAKPCFSSIRQPSSHPWTPSLCILHVRGATGVPSSVLCGRRSSLGEPITFASRCSADGMLAIQRRAAALQRISL